MTTLIVGGGWAGLAAAVCAIHKGETITLLESASQLGGRARSVELQGRVLDNGQHLVIGAYRRYLALLSTLGIAESSLFERQKMRFVLRDLQGTDRELTASRLPAPLHLITALLGAHGYTAGEKRAAITFCIALAGRRFRCPSDWTVAELLQHHRQPLALIRALWEPLCIATLNTPLSQASAQVFLRVLKDAFTRRNTDSDILIPRRPIGDWLAKPATEFIHRHGSSIKVGARVTALNVSHNRVDGVMLNDDTHIPAHKVILAIPPFAAATLLRAHPVTAGLATSLNAIVYEPIATVYLTYSPETSMDVPMLGVLGGVSQWVFDRRYTGDAGVISVVISAASSFKADSNEILGTRVTEELSRLFPHWPAPRQVRILREKRATFLCTPGMQPLRPGALTPINGLLLAGDYVDTRYPATLEGAIMGGISAIEG